MTTQETHLFSPLALRSVTSRNRIMVSPMCQYSSVDGFANDWHLVHLGSRASGGAGIVSLEATAVLPEGRISPQDLGIWKDEHIPALSRIAAFIKSQGAVPAIQLAHAGRKASTSRPWDGNYVVAPEQGGWTPVAPSETAYTGLHPAPHALTKTEIAGVVEAFRQAALRALEAGFEIIELHGAHGYLAHEFLSPLSNQRDDEYGGSLENRQRFLLEIADAVRQVWPEQLPLFARLSATDWLPDDPNSFKLTDAVAVSQALGQHGVDLVDASSGGNSPLQKIQLKPGYQVEFAETIRREAGIAVAAVGLITEAEQADAIIRSGQADIVAIAREFLRDPYWPLHAAKILGQEIEWPVQYARAK